MATKDRPIILAKLDQAFACNGFSIAPIDGGYKVCVRDSCGHLWSHPAVFQRYAAAVGSASKTVKMGEVDLAIWNRIRGNSLLPPYYFY